MYVVQVLRRITIKLMPGARQAPLHAIFVYFNTERRRLHRFSALDGIVLSITTDGSASKLV